MLKAISSFICVFGCCLGFAQTVNQGLFTVESGTQIGTLGVFENMSTGDFINDGDFFVYNHFLNDGLFSFSNGISTGMIRLKGEIGYQDISGNMPIEVYGVEFNNVSSNEAFHLSNEISVFGKADFRKGIVGANTYGGSLVFEKGATHSNVDDESFVDGVVQKVGDEPFVFPIGQKDKFRFAAISAPKNLTDTFSQKYFYENPDVLYSIKSKDVAIDFVNNEEYWLFEKNKGNTDVILTLSWDDSTTPSQILQSEDDLLHIVHWDQSQKKWIDMGGIVDRSAKTITTPANISTYGVFTIGKVVGSATTDALIIYNALSPNDDGLNDYFKIEGLLGNDNSVEIFNRWGAKVYETKAYDTSGNVFRGFSDSSWTIQKDKKLPVGTYFYVLTYNMNSKPVKKVGYLYLNL